MYSYYVLILKLILDLSQNLLKIAATTHDAPHSVFKSAESAWGRVAVGTQQLLALYLMCLSVGPLMISVVFRTFCDFNVIYFSPSLLVMAERRKTGFCDAADTKKHKLCIGSEAWCV
jgi:hypothetical protein